MADFNTGLSAPRGEGAKVLTPVRENFGESREAANPLISLGANLAGIFIQNAKEREALEKKKQQEEIMGSFTREQTALSDAIAQGTMTPAQAQARARANFSKYSANYPTLVEDFGKTNKVLYEDTSLQVAKSAEEVQRDLAKQLEGDYQKSGGFIPEGASPKLKASLLSSYQETRAAEDQFRREAARDSERRAMSAEERTQYNFEQKENAARLLISLGSTHVESAQEFVRSSLVKAKAGDVQGATLDMNQYFTNLEASINAISARDPELAQSWKSMFNGIKKVGIDGLDPKADADKLENELKTIQTRAKLAAMAAPDMQALYATSSLLGGNLPANFVQANQTVKDTFLRLTTSLPGKVVNTQVVGVPEMENAVYPTLAHNLKLLKSGSATNAEEVKTQTSIGINNILGQIGKADGLGVDAKGLNSAAKFMASPEYAYAVENGLVSKEAAFNANRAFQAIYEQGSVGALATKLSETIRVVNTFAGIDKTVPLQELVKFEWNGAGVSLGYNQKYNDTSFGYGRDRTTSDMKPAVETINRLIKIGAHREGHTNYAKFWEENKHNVLPGVYPDPNKLAVGQVLRGADGKSYKYIGGDYNDIDNSYMVVPDAGSKQ